MYVKVQPSTIRFNCQPISRVECLLQVPSLELVFSTKKTDVEGLLSEGTPPTKSKRESFWRCGFAAQGWSTTTRVLIITLSATVG